MTLTDNEAQISKANNLKIIIGALKLASRIIPRMRDCSTDISMTVDVISKENLHGHHHCRLAIIFDLKMV